MSSQERSKHPYCYSTAVLAEPFRNMYARCHERTELLTIKEAFRKSTLPISESFVVGTFLDSMRVRPTTHIHAVSAFLSEISRQMIVDEIEITLHRWVGLGNPEGARHLFDAANERDILDLRRALSDTDLSREYEGEEFILQQPESILRQIAERELLRAKIRERVNPSSLQTRV
ncbi:MAG: hypothetical protein WBC38_00720 [Microgenomates group bacterium]